jgi:hypothetical protein
LASPWGCFGCVTLSSLSHTHACVCASRSRSWWPTSTSTRQWRSATPARTLCSVARARRASPPWPGAVSGLQRPSVGACGHPSRPSIIRARTDLGDSPPMSPMQQTRASDADDDHLGHDPTGSPQQQPQQPQRPAAAAASGRGPMGGGGATAAGASPTALRGQSHAQPQPRSPEDTLRTPEPDGELDRCVALTARARSSPTDARPQRALVGRRSRRRAQPTAHDGVQP